MTAFWTETLKRCHSGLLGLHQVGGAVDIEPHLASMKQPRSFGACPLTDLLNFRGVPQGTN